MFKKYRTGELLKYLGVSRDTLRFYEEKKLLSPMKNNENNYRGYDIFDIFKIMIIDFYKKRGMTINEIHDLLQNSDIHDLHTVFEGKVNELEKIIYESQRMIQRIKETQEFSSNLSTHLNTFSIKPLPLYKINGELSDFIAVEEYEHVIDIMQSDNDMLSQIMRYISFDKKEIISTKMIIVEVAEKKNDKDILIHFPQCLYTVIEEIQPKTSEAPDTMMIMHKLSHEYANEHGLRLLGEAFARIRLITYMTNKTKSYMEIFIPFTC